MSWKTGLEGAARDFAASDEQRLRVMAGPGTGKSFALQRRVARLLERGQDPTRIMVVTFTRNAAASLVRDLRSLNVVGCEKIHVGTLHSYCFVHLNRADVFQYSNRVPRPLVMLSKAGSLQFEGGVLLYDLISDRFGSKRGCTKRIRAFEAAWARLQSDEPGWAQQAIDLEFHNELVSWLRFHKAMLIGELVPEALRFLRNNPLSAALNEFDHVIVDEYQDLNRAEQVIVDLLAEKCASAIVGDVDQSIYGFRHANPEGIDDYLSRHPTTRDETLTECRRCPTRVVTIANKLISNNHPESSTPRLAASLANPDGEISIVQWNDPDEEAHGIAEFVQYLVGEIGYRPQEILIITPRRRLAYLIRDVVRERQLPIHSYYQEEALEEKCAQRALALLTLLSNGEDRVSLRWWLGHKSSTGLRNQYKTLREHCETVGRSPKEVLDEIDEGKIVLSGVSHLLLRFRELKEEIRSLTDMPLPDLIESLLPEGDEECAALREIAVLAYPRCNNVNELYNQIRAQITQPEVPDGEYVRIMSPQKAKGLTSRVVIVTGCIEGLLPVIDDTLSPKEADDNISEQRRLFYVAITRCTDILVLSSVVSVERKLAMNIGARIANFRGHWAGTICSRFIGELGPSAPASRAGSAWKASGFHNA